MATTTTTTPTGVTSVTTSWLKQHETLLIVVLVLVFGVFGLSKLYNVESARADAKNAAAQQQLVDAKANAATAAATAAQVQAQYVTLVQALAAQNTSLRASIGQRTATRAVQKTKDAALPVQGVADNWNAIAGTLVTPAGDNIIVSSTDAHKTLDVLRSVPTLQGNLADETTIAANTQQELNGADKDIAALNTQVTALNTQIVTADNACKTQVAAAKADGKKNAAKWFKRGLLVGFVSGIFLGHAAGI